MHKGRLEAFSDGVLAIILTIMVLEIKVPHGLLRRWRPRCGWCPIAASSAPLVPGRKRGSKQQRAAAWAYTDCTHKLCFSRCHGPPAQLLTPGQCYRVARAFIDYDQCQHPVGETWVVERTAFLPYEDGLTLHVRSRGLPLTFRLQWSQAQQSAIVERFANFVAAC